MNLWKYVGSLISSRRTGHLEEVAKDTAGDVAHFVTVQASSPISGRRNAHLEELAEDTAGYLAHLATLENQIRETVLDIEQAVVEVGAGFEGMATRARESVDDASQLLGAEKGSGVEALLSASRRTLDQLLQQIGRGGDISAVVARRMHELKASAGGIVKSLGEIENIAFSSKLVALNAKIEAAHLGERGSAFGVVANEISSQAKRSEEIAERVISDMQRMRNTVDASSSDLDEMGRLSVDTLEASRKEVEGALDGLTLTHQAMQNSLQKAVARAEQLAGEIARSVMAFQFQDRVSQRLGHVADCLAGIRVTIGAPLEFLKAETPALGERRRLLVEADVKTQYTMHAERAAAAPHGENAGETLNVDTELF
jgi:methyl-accepting chemotaxis protein